MKKFLALLLLCAIAATLFPACKDSESQPSTPPAQQPEVSEYAVKDLSYIASAISGYDAVRKIAFSSPESNEGLTEYALYWGANGKPLENFTKIASLPADGDSYVYDLPPNTYVPEEAEEIIAETWFHDVKLETTAAKLPALDRSEKLFEFQVISDFQLGYNGTQQTIRTENAFRQIKELSPATSGIFIVGDMTEHGTESEYQDMASIVSRVYGNEKPDLYYAIGNHESYNKQTYTEMLALYEKYTGQNAPYYTVEISGMKFIVLGSVRESAQVGVYAELGREQLDWLEKELEATDDKTTVFLFLHQPLKNTVSGTLESLSQTWYGLYSDEDLRLRQILKNHTNVTFFTGHTHWHLESESPALFGNGKDANYFNTASVGYLWQGEGGGGHYPGSQGLFVEVFEDYFTVRGREFENEMWLTDAQYVLPRTFA